MTCIKKYLWDTSSVQNYYQNIPILPSLMGALQCGFRSSSSHSVTRDCWLPHTTQSWELSAATSIEHFSGWESHIFSHKIITSGLYPSLLKSVLRKSQITRKCWRRSEIGFRFLSLFFFCLLSLIYFSFIKQWRKATEASYAMVEGQS